ncbi:hypothetical protein MAR_010289 [Mya arenaria]|uniref:Uncharacterized protein n=1 Tax=Mya arenaria TaxID=6604 RepID=A0ABY7E9A1_MYAAR|nr:hypothetical protein MAR_010289 [Mya arenaria]
MLTKKNIIQANKVLQIHLFASPVAEHCCVEWASYFHIRVSKLDCSSFRTLQPVVVPDFHPYVIVAETLDSEAPANTGLRAYSATITTTLPQQHSLNNAPHGKTNFEIGVISAITLTVAVFSTVGVTVILYPWNVDRHLERNSRYIVQSTDLLPDSAGGDVDFWCLPC